MWGSHKISRAAGRLTISPVRCCSAMAASLRFSKGPIPHSDRPSGPSPTINGKVISGSWNLTGSERVFASWSMAYIDGGEQIDVCRIGMVRPLLRSPEKLGRAVWRCGCGTDEAHGQHIGQLTQAMARDLLSGECGSMTRGFRADAADPAPDKPPVMPAMPWPTGHHGEIQTDDSLAPTILPHWDVPGGASACRLDPRWGSGAKVLKAG